MRGKDIAIGVTAALGFAAIIHFTGGGGGGDQTAAPAPPALPPPSPPPPAPATPAEAPAGPEATPAPGEISVLSLLGEMIDLERLARLPATRFKAAQAASTDRRSRRPEDGDAWFANDDFVTDTLANLVRVETRPDGGKRYVLLDADGPGAIVRIWTATIGGMLCMYIDGEATPALEAPVAALLRGAVPPFVAPLAHVVGRGNNLFFPFPFARHCLVTVDDIVSPDPFTGRPMAKLYYQIGYRRYGAPDAARVRPYSAVELARAAPTIRRVARVLQNGPPPAANVRTVPIAAAAVDPGHPSVTTITAPAGGGEVTELRITTAERTPQRLRSTRLTITFDGETTVDAPLIDFFGTGPAWNTYSTLPFTVAGDNLLVCRFRMPFAKRAVVTIARTDPGAIDIAGAIDVTPAPFEKDSLLFHAAWRPREMVRTRPFRDWNVARIDGQGQLVGTVLNIDNPPGANWWGEGDEKIYVDGEAFPSLFGTGTEDYFGYAWSTTERFEHAYHAQTATAGDGFGGLYSMNRFHILDPIPFSRSLRFDFEIWHWTDTSIAVDATAYWY
ncbi:MAG TPA: glycoside hydrolase family 172 protein, partial [Polyangia bacterium]|nr:glycoside hydrolase family 172 protein [Polyangia bacterium]